MADVISGRCSVELMNIFNYTASSNIFFVLFEISYHQTFQQHKKATSDYQHFVFLITCDKSETNYNYLAWSDALAPEDSEKTFVTHYISVPKNIIMCAVSFYGYTF